MECSTNNPAVRRYMYRFLATMLLYAMFLIASVWALSARGNAANI